MPVTAPISMSKIKAEFGGTGRMSEYVRGGALVPNTSANTAIATTAAALKMSQFLGATKTQPFSVTANDVYKVEISNVPESTSTATAHNAPGVVTWSWTHVSGYALLWGATNTNVATFRSAIYGGYEGVYRVTATSAGQTAGTNISVYLQRGNIE